MNTNICSLPVRKYYTKEGKKERDAELSVVVYGTKSRSDSQNNVLFL